MQGADFAGDDLEKTELTQAFTENTNFKGANLAGQELYGNFTGTNFDYANLAGATLIGNFKNDTFVGASFVETKFCNAVIEGVMHEPSVCPGSYIP
jgi:uncharacterized protein YjbI with pentapeptide repeats